MQILHKGKKKYGVNNKKIKKYFRNYIKKLYRCTVSAVTQEKLVDSTIFLKRIIIFVSCSPL